MHISVTNKYNTIWVINFASISVNETALKLCDPAGCSASLQVGGYSHIIGPGNKINELNAKLGFSSEGSLEDCDKMLPFMPSNLLKEYIFVILKPFYNALQLF